MVISNNLIQITRKISEKMEKLENVSCLDLLRIEFLQVLRRIFIGSRLNAFLLLLRKLLMMINGGQMLE